MKPRHTVEFCLDHARIFAYSAVRHGGRAKVAVALKSAE